MLVLQSHIAFLCAADVGKQDEHEQEDEEQCEHEEQGELLGAR